MISYVMISAIRAMGAATAGDSLGSTGGGLACASAGSVRSFPTIL